MSCVEGSGRGQNDSIETRLVPEMEFICNGTIVRWTVSGRAGQGTQFPKLQVWRRADSVDKDEYHKQGQEIQIDAEGSVCEEITQTCDQIFHCSLSADYQVSIQSGSDIVGVELPPVANQGFELFFMPGSQIQYIWQQELASNNTTIRIGSQDNTTTDHLLLSLNISTGKKLQFVLLFHFMFYILHHTPLIRGQ